MTPKGCHPEPEAKDPVETGILRFAQNDIFDVTSPPLLTKRRGGVSFMKHNGLKTHELCILPGTRRKTRFFAYPF